MTAIYAALIAVGGVVIGAAIGTFPSLNAQAEQGRERFMALLQQLLAAIANVDAAVQDWHRFGVLYREASAEEKRRFLEEAGGAAGRLATALIAVEGLAHAADPDGPLGRATNEFAILGRAQIEMVPGRVDFSQAGAAYIARRQSLVREVSRTIRIAQEASIPFSHRVTGTFRPRGVRPPGEG